MRISPGINGLAAYYLFPRVWVYPTAETYVYPTAGPTYGEEVLQTSGCGGPTGPSR